MTRILVIIAIAVLFVCYSCGNRTQRDILEVSVDVDTICSCPQCQIILQPYSDFKQEDVEKLLPTIKDAFDKWLYGYWEFKILDPIEIPKESYVQDRDRYKVTPILNFQSHRLKANEVIIGLTHKDICTDIHGQKNYGIVGISRPLKQVCLVSDRRLKDKSQYRKPILHEFMHTFYGAPHCPADNPKCFMKDAKGHGNFNIQDKLCDYCKQ